MSICAQFLSAARQVAKKRNGWTDRGCAVLGGDGVLNKYYFVEKYEGGMAWEGEAHCKYCARTEAIAHMADEVMA